MRRAIIVFVLVAIVTGPALGQEDLDRAAASQQLEERVQRLVDMGMEREVATWLSILSEAGMDPTQLALMMMMGEESGGRGMAMLPLMMMEQKGASGPAIVDRGDEVLIVDGGTLYVVDTEAMEVTGSLTYDVPKRIEDSPVWSLLMPMISDARGEARTTACLSNVKQLCLGFLMYSQDHDEVLPPEGWVAETYPYVNNHDIYRCPARPDQTVGYAMNEQLAGVSLAQIAEPAKTVLLFETFLDEESPIGGPETVPEEGVHEGGIVCGFADGHAKWVPAEEARDLLARPGQVQ